MQIISFLKPNGNRAIAVLPKTSSLKSLAQGNTNQKFLWEVERVQSRESTTEVLLYELEVKVAELLQIDSEGFLRIDKSKIPAECNITDDIPTESAKSSAATSSIQTTQTAGIGEGLELATTDAVDTRIESSAVVADEELEEATKVKAEKISREKKKRKARKRKIWRVVGYTLSGEPCIEEHEPEASNADNSLPSSLPTHTTAGAGESSSHEYDFYNSETEFTPGTSVVSDCDTITASLNDGDSLEDYAKKLEEANKEIESLEKKLLEATTHKEDRFEAQQRMFDVLQESAIEQEKRIKNHELEEQNTRAIIETMKIHIATLEDSLRVAKDAEAAEKRQCEEAQALLKKLGELARGSG